MQDENTTPEAEAAKAAKPPKAPQSTLNRSEKAEIVKAVRSTNTAIMNPVAYEQAKLLAADIIRSKAAPKSFDNPEQIVMAIIAGNEMGMSPIEALQSLYYVNGALNIWGKALPRRLREHGYTIGYQDETPDGCTVVVKNHDGSEMYTETRTFQESKDSGYTDGSNGLKIGWKLGVNRKLKLRYGALSDLIKTYLPEVMGSAAGIVEVDQDFDPDQIADNDKTKIKIALDKAAPEQIEETAASVVEQVQ